MKKQFLRAARGRFLPVFFALLALVLLGGLASTRATAQEPVLPQAPPDAANGLELFADRCANCHGPAGAGDGEMASRLPMPPRAFTDPAYLRSALPSDMYSIITNGNLDAGMPPFGPASSNPIAEPDRWDLIAAVYALGTPAGSLESGQALYEANCLACHGEGGQGDGPEAADLENPASDLTDVSYWYNRSNETVISALQSGEIPAHSYELSDAELVDVVNYSRTFSYAYVDPLAPVEPIAAATISGQVINATTGEAITEGAVQVRAFTRDFQEAFSDTTTIGADGRYTLDVTDVSPEWVFFTSTEYGDLSFSSDPNQLSRTNPTLDLPIEVFETTSDVSAVSVEQVHIIAEFVAEDQLQVTELYVFNNSANAVFVGESGVPEEGTISVVLPTGAENPIFQRSFGSLDSFLPANEIQQTERGWTDTLPLRAGQAAMNLLVRYQLPYESGMRLAHPINYDTARTSLIIPDAGVEVVGNEWAAQAPQQMGNAGTLLSYAGPAVSAGDALSVQLEGRPRPSEAAASTGMGNTAVARNNTTEIIIGFSVLALVVVGAVFAVRQWQRPEAPEVATQQVDTRSLLLAVANLDQAYEAGQLDEETYRRQRAQLMDELAANWQRGE